MSQVAPSTATDRQWFIVGRWQEYDGEARANLLRIVGIGAFYVVQLINYQVLAHDPAGMREFHYGATAIAVCWSLVALASLFCLRRQIFPVWLKFAATAADILLVTALASLTETRANGSLVLVYPLIIALASVRFSLGLVWFATLGSMAGYMALVGATDEVWFDPDHQVRIIDQLVTLLSLGLTGIILGQVIRRTRTMADDYAQRMQTVARENE